MMMPAKRSSLVVAPRNSTDAFCPRSRPGASGPLFGRVADYAFSGGSAPRPPGDPAFGQ